MEPNHERFIRLAMAEAERAHRAGNRPFGAVLVDPAGHVAIAEHNRTVEQHDPTAHAEMMAIRALCRERRSPRLEGCWLYTNAQPCPMCFCAMVEVRIARLYYAAPPAPGVWPTVSIGELADAFDQHRITVYGGILAGEATAQLERLNAAKPAESD